MNIIVYYTERAIKTIAERIENSLGGNVDIVNDKKEETLTVDWKKNDKTVYALQFKKVYSYKDLEAFSDPGAIVMDFIKAYASPKEVKPLNVKQLKSAKVEKPERSKVVKAENPKVEE